MVGWYFMHLKFEGKWVYAMLIPAGILAMHPDVRPDSRRRHAAGDRGEPRGGGIAAGLASLEPGRGSPPTSAALHSCERLRGHESYRLGILIVLATIFASARGRACACAAGSARDRPAPAERAAEDLGRPGARRSAAFRLIERSGRAVTDADLADRVWVASFIFTRCPLSCPRITSVMKGLQDEARRHGRPARQPLGRSRPRHARGARRLRPRVRRPTPTAGGS